MREFLAPRGITMYRLAKAIGKPQSAVSRIVHGRCAVTPEMSCLLAAALGTEPDFWLELEASYQLGKIDSSLAEGVESLA